MQVNLASPRGFCAGVDRAIEIVERALELLDPPIYVFHEVVHNRYVVDSLKEKGAIFVEDIAAIPSHSTVIFSAHGVSKAICEQANKRNLRIFDATCPLVTKVHLEVARYSREQYECILIGHDGHPEVEGTKGQYQQGQSGEGGIYLVENVADVARLKVNNPEKLAYVTQTTLSVNDTQRIIEALLQRFPAMQSPKKEDICYATQNRQDAVKTLAQHNDVVLVVGSVNSSNSNRLREVAAQQNCNAYLIDNADEIRPQWLLEAKQIGVTAGASAPEILVQEVCQRLVQLGADNIVALPGVEETITFVLPKSLRKKKEKHHYDASKAHITG